MIKKTVQWKPNGTTLVQQKDMAAKPKQWLKLQISNRFLDFKILLNQDMLRMYTSALPRILSRLFITRLEIIVSVTNRIRMARLSGSWMTCGVLWLNVILSK